MSRLDQAVFKVPSSSFHVQRFKSKPSIESRDLLIKSPRVWAKNRFCTCWDHSVQCALWAYHVSKCWSWGVAPWNSREKWLKEIRDIHMAIWWPLYSYACMRLDVSRVWKGKGIMKDYLWYVMLFFPCVVVTIRRIVVPFHGGLWVALWVLTEMASGLDPILSFLYTKKAQGSQ